MSAPLRHLVLASGSTARHALLSQASIAHRVVPSRVGERFEGLTTRQAVTELAARKAREVASRLPGDLVLGCDSLLELDGRPYGKPRGKEEARALWRSLSGRRATLWTGHVLIDGESGRTEERAVATTISFGRPDEEELEAYIEGGAAEMLAGGFSIEGEAGFFLDGIEGEPSNVMGLSLSCLREMLAALGYRLEDFSRRRRRFEVRPLGPPDRPLLTDFVSREWGLPLVSTSGVHDAGRLEGFIAEAGGRPLGLLCHALGERGLEVVLLQSLVEGVGVGSALLREAAGLAAGMGVRLWLITTDENTAAISFYLGQKMRLVAVHRDFVTVVGAHKPHLLEEEVFNDALEFEYEAPERPAAKGGASGG